MAGERILRDVEDFGRRQPLAVMFGGLAAGFVASRFLKASSTRRAQAGPSTSTVPTTPAVPTRPTASTAPARPAAPLTPPVAAEPARPAENVSLTGGVLPPSGPGTGTPGGAA